MDILMIIIVVIGLIAKANKTKKAQEEARRKREAARAAAAGTPSVDPRYPQQMRMPLEPPAPTVQPTVVTRKLDPRFFDTEEDEAERKAELAKIKQQAALREQEQKRREEQARRQQQNRQRIVLPDDESEGTAAPGSLTASVASTMASTMELPKGRRHTLEASSVTGHAHAETSMTGFESDAECAREPDKAVRTGAAASYTFGARALSFDRDAVVSGILYAEILGKPKALRRA